MVVAQALAGVGEQEHVGLEAALLLHRIGFDA